MKRLKFLQRVICAALAGTAALLGACALADAGGASGEGIVIYYGNDILNGKNIEIVTEGVRQLRVMVTPSGDAVIWNSDNSAAVTVTETGRIRANKNPGRTALITASSRENPAIRAEVSFTTKGLR